MQQYPEDEQRFAFHAEWHDSQASLLRRYLLFFYSSDEGIELYDTKTNKKVVRRGTFKEIKKNDMFVGNTILLLSKKMTLIGYADEHTRIALCQKAQRTFAMIKPDGIANMGGIISEIYNFGFRINKAKMVQMSEPMTRIFYKEHQETPFFGELTRYMSSGPVVAMELVGERAVLAWRELLGPTDSNKAKKDCPDTIRGRFGTDITKNAAHGSDGLEAVERELEFFFPSKKEDRVTAPLTTATFNNCTCCVLKPHAVQEGIIGEIIKEIQLRGFHITALQMFNLEIIDAEEFYEIYKDVVAEYSKMVTHLSSGLCVAMEITGDMENIPLSFRDFVGPSDPGIARQVRPHSLRAKYGKDKILNAVHCTDLPEDGVMEVEFFFKMLQ